MYLSGPLYVLGSLVAFIGCIGGSVWLGKEQWALGVYTILSGVFAGFLLLALGEITQSLKAIVKSISPDDGTEEEGESEE